MLDNEGTIDVGANGSGSSADGGDTSGNSGTYIEQTGDSVSDDNGSNSDGGGSQQATGSGDNLEGSGVGNAEFQDDDISSTQSETVDPAQFDDAMQLLGAKMDAMNTSLMIVVVALFVCAGIMAVENLIDSFKVRDG